MNADPNPTTPLDTQALPVRWTVIDLENVIINGANFERRCHADNRWTGNNWYWPRFAIINGWVYERTVTNG